MNNLKNMKVYPILLGVVSLIIFGLIIPNGFQALFILVSIGYSTNQFLLALCILLLSSLALMGLSIMDYTASRIHRLRWLCGLAIIIHAIMNGGLYAMEIDYISAGLSDINLFKFCISIFVIAIAVILYKRINIDDQAIKERIT